MFPLVFRPGYETGFPSFFICAFAVSAWPQTHTAGNPSNRCLDSILARKGKWAHVEEDWVFPDKTFPRNQYPLVDARIDAIGQLVKNAVPQLNGIEPVWYRGMRGDAYRANGPVPYRYGSLYFPYLCNETTNKIVLDGEADTSIYVFVNKLIWFMDYADSLDIHGKGKDENHICIAASLAAYRFQVGKMPVTAATMAVQNYESGPLDWTDEKAMHIIGTIGADFIEARVVVFDYPRRRLHNGPQTPTSITPDVVTSPFMFPMRSVLLPAIIRGKSALLFFDTGSNAYEFLTDRKAAEAMAVKDAVPVQYPVRFWNRTLTATTLATGGQHCHSRPTTSLATHCLHGRRLRYAGSADDEDGNRRHDGKQAVHPLPAGAGRKGKNVCGTAAKN